MKGMKSSSQRLSLWLTGAACLLSGAESFAPPLRPFSRPSVPTGPRLHLESLNSQPSSSSAPSWIDLPGRKEPLSSAWRTTPGSAAAGPNDDDDAARQLDGVELAIGRVAIFGATGILVKELLTGESILDQCGDMLRGCLS